MRILIPVDGSEPSKKTLEWVVSTLDKASTSVLLLTVIGEPMIAEYRVEDADEILNEARQFLESHRVRVEKSAYLLGDPVERICAYAEDEEVDQIIIGSHGRGGLAKMLLGSVSQGVLEQSEKPVLIARETHAVLG